MALASKACCFCQQRPLPPRAPRALQGPVAAGQRSRSRRLSPCCASPLIPGPLLDLVSYDAGYALQASTPYGTALLAVVWECSFVEDHSMALHGAPHSSLHHIMLPLHKTCINTLQLKCRSFTGLCLQDLIVGGAVVSAVGAALYGGLKKDAQTCDLCLGTGVCVAQSWRSQLLCFAMQTCVLMLRCCL